MIMFVHWKRVGIDLIGFWYYIVDTIGNQATVMIVEVPLIQEHNWDTRKCPF